MLSIHAYKCSGLERIMHRSRVNAPKQPVTYSDRSYAQNPSIISLLNTPTFSKQCTNPGAKVNEMYRYIQGKALQGYINIFNLFKFYIHHGAITDFAPKRHLCSNFYMCMYIYIYIYKFIKLY